MKDTHISYGLTADGFLFSCSTHIVILNNNGGLAFAGKIQWGERYLSDIIKESEADLSEHSKSILDAMLPKCNPKEIYVSYYDKILMAGLQERGIQFKLAKSADNIAILLVLKRNDISKINSDKTFIKEIKKLLDEISSFLGIQEIVLYVQAKKNSLLPYMIKNSWTNQIPQNVMSGNMLMYSNINFEGDSVLCQGIRLLFGIKETSLYIAMADSSLSAAINLPEIDTKYIKSQNLYMQIQTGSQLQFYLKGTFIFPYLKNVEFNIDCGIKQTSFRIEAEAKIENPIELFGPVKLKDTCLMMQLGAEFEFGLYSSIFIRNLGFFGAIILKESAGTIYPTLLSAAISDLSLPILADNILGQHINGIEALDFIKIQGLTFQKMSNFPIEKVKNKDVNAIVEQFNREVTSEMLRLEPTQVQITPFGQGADVTDLKRMRHYYISNNGSIKLSAQFYYATEDTTFGKFMIEKGIFICGVIEILGKKFEALFSIRESEGILAYAKIPAIDLGFIKIDASEYQQKSALPIPENSPLAQFVNPKQEGMVFYLSAGKSGVSFYFDGSIEILRMYQVDARILYINKYISVDAHLQLYGLFQVSLHLLVDYSNFLSGNFEFSFLFDTAGLTQKLTAVTDKIDGAVQRLRDKFDNANREIDRAQRNVNELYSQIDELNRRIENCNRDIRNASWWKRVFVSISKGIEIGMYEAAKAAVYVSIGVATAALNVAKGVLSLSDKIGESFLNAVNSVIKGAMSLLYINYIRLDAKASLSEQYFNAEIDFVVLGKNYNIKKLIARNSLENNPTGALSDSINSEISGDLDNIEDGSYRSSWSKYSFKQYTVEQNKRKLIQAKQQLESSVDFMKSMQNIYMENMNVSMEECNEMNTSLMYAMNDVESILLAGVQSGNMSVLGNAMGGLKRSVAYQEKKDMFRGGELSKAKALIDEYDAARDLYDNMLDSIKTVQRFQREIENYNDRMMKKTHDINTQRPTENQMKKVLCDVEKKMYEIFPVNRSSADFINISKESLIQNSFKRAEEKIGTYSDREVLAMRNRSRKGDYHDRLNLE